MVPATFEGSVAIIKKAQYDFPKMRGGGGVKGRLELFQKFIRFGMAALPLRSQVMPNFRLIKNLEI